MPLSKIGARRRKYLGNNAIELLISFIYSYERRVIALSFILNFYCYI